MENEVYRMLKIKALERWENEGGSIRSEHISAKAKGEARDHSQESAARRYSKAKSFAAGA